MQKKYDKLIETRKLSSHCFPTVLEESGSSLFWLIFLFSVKTVQNSENSELLVPSLIEGLRVVQGLRVVPEGLWPEAN